MNKYNYDNFPQWDGSLQGQPLYKVVDAEGDVSIAKRTLSNNSGWLEEIRNKEVFPVAWCCFKRDKRGVEIKLGDVVWYDGYCYEVMINSKEDLMLVSEQCEAEYLYDIPSSELYAERVFKMCTLRPSPLL